MARGKPVPYTLTGKAHAALASVCANPKHAQPCQVDPVTGQHWFMPDPRDWDLDTQLSRKDTGLCRRYPGCGCRNECGEG